LSGVLGYAGGARVLFIVGSGMVYCEKLDMNVQMGVGTLAERFGTERCDSGFAE
jgi:hypothetical protein